MRSKLGSNQVQHLSGRIDSPNRWNRPWLYWVGAWFTLFTAYFLAGLFGNLLFDWLEVPFVPYWIQPENLLGAVLIAMFLFICFVIIDTRVHSALPTLDNQPEPFGLVSLCVFLLFIGMWAGCVILVEALGGFPGYGIVQESVLSVVSYMLALCGAVFLLIWISRN